MNLTVTIGQKQLVNLSPSVRKVMLNADGAKTITLEIKVFKNFELTTFRVD
jgi:hypothetical protein